MKFADWLRGVETVVLKDVLSVFSVAKTAVGTASLPQNIKDDTTQLLSDAQDDLVSVGGLAGTLVGNIAADAVEDVTTLLMNTAGAVSAAKSPSEFSAAEKTVLQKAWVAARAQGDTLLAQFMAGIDPAKPATVNVGGAAALGGAAAQTTAPLAGQVAAGAPFQGS